MRKNWNAERGTSEEARSFKSYHCDGNERSLQGSPPGPFSLEYDSEPGIVSDRSSEVGTGSTTPIDWVLQALSNRERLVREEKQNQDGGKQDLKPRTPDYENSEELGMGKMDEPDILLDSNTPKVPWKSKKYAGTYEMEKYKKNAMIIFNHKDFLGGSTTRLGTMQDEEALKTTFEMFNFEVESHLDLDKKTLLQELKKFCSKDFREYGCVCVAILTHGSEYGYLKAYDTRYTEHEIIECFNKPKKPYLFGKPIIILIQACRGAVPATSCNPETPKTDVDVEMDYDDHYELPTESNMVIFHSSYVGRASARQVTKGSWFIQSLCEQIKLLAADEDFESICRAVRQEVALDKEHKMILNNKPVIAKQMPVITSTLLRLLYLRKYEGDIQDDLNPKEELEKENKAVKAEANIQCSKYVKRCLRVVGEGTWFIQTICEQLKLYAPTEQLKDIFRRVRKVKALEKGFENEKQMPVMSSTSPRKLYLIPQSNFGEAYSVNCTNNDIKTVRFNAKHDTTRDKMYLVDEHAFIGIALTIGYLSLLYPSVVRDHIYFFASLLFVYMGRFDVSWTKMLSTSVLFFIFLKIAGVNITWEIVKTLCYLTG